MSPLTPVQREAAPPPSAHLGYNTSPRNNKSSAISVSTVATSSTIENHHHLHNNNQQQHHQQSPGDSMNNHMRSNGDNRNMSNIQQLQAALEEANQRDATAKAALARSDAVILELRSSIRQLKRQVEHVQSEKYKSSQDVDQLQRQLASLEHAAAHSLQEEQQLHSKHVSQLQSQLQLSETQAKEQMVGELQVQLDRAHAQILTADMVRKELEDTLEAEQYTWELRVQDQERQLLALQEECTTCQEDLAECRAQWREAEEGWTAEIKELKQEQGSSRSKGAVDADVMGKLSVLEKEREELQGCLDEAMKELEAVDQELRQNPNVLEPLQHLYRWLLERNNLPDRNIPSDANQLVSKIEDLIERESTGSWNGGHNNGSKVKVAELEAQLSVYRGDLKAREESSAELRASLKEAVALLKPLQDAVAKTDNEKKEMEQELDSLRSERDHFESKIKNSPAGSPRALQAVTARSMPSGEEQEETGSARSKRNKAQESLAKMLNSAQSRFQELHTDNSAIVQENEMLAKRVEELENELMDARSVGDEESIKRDVNAEMREAAIIQLQEDVKGYSQQLARKERKMQEMEAELEQAQDTSASVAASDYDALKSQAEELEQEVSQKREIERQLASVKKDLLLKAEAERMLNESLKEALVLLKPLQMHLETAEKEKKVVTKQLKSVKKKLFKLETGQDARSVKSSSTIPDDQASDLEVIIQELQHENSQLRPQQSKLQEDLVSMRSRYAVTQDKLESATVENHALVDALKQKEHDEQEMLAELEALRKKVEKSEHELDNAKYIATSALMKVEELTMSNLSSNLTRDIVQHKQQQSGFGQQQQSPGEVQRLKQKLASLEQEVSQAHELNDSLEESIQERDRMLHALTDKQSLSPGMRKTGGQRVKWDH